MTTLESTTERLESALNDLAREASELFTELLASGAELPYEIEPAGDGPLPMYQYKPLTGSFIAESLVELRRLDSFAEVREIAGEEVATGFLVGLWGESTEFEIEPDRLRGAIDGVLSALPSASGAETAAGEVIVPLIGFHMPADEIVLDGVRIVRADSLDDAPVDAIDATRSGRDSRPGFFAQVSCGLAVVAPAAAVSDDLRRALRTMRLFKQGNVGLAARGWTRRAGGWERFDTGASRPRSGGYRLTGAETAELETFAKTLVKRGDRVPALAWAASRFDLGAERPSLIEALSDYLLALRGLLEGGGPARASLAARVAALTCEPQDRESARICVARALTLERKLMSGGPVRPDDGYSPLEVIGGVEELLRRTLKKLTAGELEGDLRAAADEMLLADGLTHGIAESTGPGETAEWRIPDLSAEPIQVPEPEEGEITIRRFEFASRRSESPVVAERASEPEAPETEQTSVIEPIGRADTDHGERPAWSEDRRGGDMSEPDDHTRTFAGADAFDEPTAETRADWFAAGEEGELEWPAFARPRRDREGDGTRDHHEGSERVRYLFPVPDATDWDVGELRYKSKRTGS